MRFTRTAITTMIICFCATGAGAEETRPPLEITVHPLYYTTAISDQAQEKNALREVPGSAALITQDSWNNQKATTIKDITDYVPGVYAQPRNGAESSRLSIRGSGLANVFQGRGLLVMQDGIPINMADGEFEFPVIDPWLIGYATILPGANALADGASTLGGAIDFTTPNGKTAPGISLRNEGGSFGTLHSLVSVGEEWKNGDGFAAVSGFRQNGFRQNNEQENLRLNGNAGWRSNDSVENRFYISHTISNAEIPGTLSRAEIRTDPKQSNPNNTARNFERNLDITRLGFRSAWQYGPDRIDTTLYYTYRTLDNPVTTYILEDNNDFGVRLKYTHELGRDKWIAGFNAGYGMQDETRYQNIGGNRGAFILSRDLNALTTEAYAQYDRNIAGRFYGVASLQLSYNTRNISENAPSRNEQNKVYAGYNPRFGFRFDIDPENQLFTNISRSFEPPSWGELSGGNSPGFNDLDAQTATTVEIGGRGTLHGMQWSATLYRSWLKDEFVNYRFEDGTSDTINADRTLHDGLELGISGPVLSGVLKEGDSVDFRAAYTWSAFHLDGDALYGDNTLPGMPEHYLRSEILYRHPSGLSLGPNIEWVPAAYPVDLTNTYKADSYAVYGARLSWSSPNHRVETYIEGRNLLDRNYTATTNVIPDAAGQDGRYFYPGEGRAVYAGLRWKF